MDESHERTEREMRGSIEEGRHPDGNALFPRVIAGLPASSFCDRANWMHVWWKRCCYWSSKKDFDRCAPLVNSSLRPLQPRYNESNISLKLALLDVLLLLADCRRSGPGRYI